jgi:PAS domain S-box-containing protein
VRILIADDHELVRRGVRSVLRARPDIEICGEAIDGQDAIDHAQLLCPDLIVMDISMPRLNGLEATREIRRILPTTDILILSQHNSPEMMRQALNAGARGYVVKTAISEDLLIGIDKVQKGQLFFGDSVSGNAMTNVDMQEILQRSQAFETALRKSEELYRLTFEQAAVGIAHISKDGNYLRVNQKFREILGRTQEDLRRLTTKDITHPGDLRADLNHSEKVAAGELDQYSIETRLIRKDGSAVWVNKSVSAVRDSDRRLNYLVGVVEDITQRKQAELALADAARHQKALFHLADHLHRATSADEVFSAAIEAILGALECDRASISLFDEQGRMRSVSWCGLSDAYRAATDGQSPWHPGGCTAQPITISDIETAALEPHLKAAVKAEGIGALALVPLVSNGKLIGKFMSYFNAPHIFSESDIELGLTIARQLVFALERQHGGEDLRQSEERFRAIVETSPECVMLVTSDGILLHMNAAGLAIVGAESAEAVVGQSVYHLIAPEDRERFRAFNEKVCRGAKGSLEFEISGLLGTRRQMDTRAVPLRQPDGQVVQLGMARDITLRKRGERASRLLASIVDSSDDAIISKNLDGVITSWNKGAERLFGYTPEEAIGQHITLIIPPDRRDEEMEILARLKRGERVDHFETVRITKDRALLDISLTISPVKDLNGRVTGASKVARNITDRKRAEERLRESENRFRILSERLDSEVRARTRELELSNADVMRQSEQLRELSWQMLRIQDEERRHIARELHDSAGQLLTILAMNLATLTRNAQKNKVPEIAEAAEEARELVHQLTGEIRTTSYLLHPPLLDEEGLRSAISWYVRGLVERSGLDITFNISEGFGRLPGEMELAIFRLVQECLTNIHRHSGSKRAAIDIFRTPEQVLLEVRDEGKGISRERLVEIQSQGAGFGIRGMRERARQFNGEMTIESNGCGTLFHVAIPVPKNEAVVDEPKTQIA